MDVTFEELGTYLRVQCQGDWDQLVLTETAKAIGTQATRTSHKCILIDWRNVARSMQTIDRYSAGKDIAESIGREFRIAVIDHKERTTRFLENVALNRGVSFKVFDDESDAVEWLLHIHR